MTDQLDVLHSLYGHRFDGLRLPRGRVSDVQTRDVRAIIAVQGAPLDWDYMTTWAATLDISIAHIRQQP